MGVLENFPLFFKDDLNMVTRIHNMYTAWLQEECSLFLALYCRVCFLFHL